MNDRVKTATTAETRQSTTSKVVVATTVALSFISFWRTAAVVLSDLASSAFYAGGIAEHAIGKSATGLITLFAGMIIPDSVRGRYVDNLLGGLTSHLAGPALLRLLFHIFVVIVGVLILSGAVNTSIIGANGVMNRLAEDRVLLDWFRRPHKR